MAHTGAKTGTVLLSSLTPCLLIVVWWLLCAVIAIPNFIYPFLNPTPPHPTVLIVGGVGCNKRLQSMMQSMLEDREGGALCAMDDRYGLGFRLGYWLDRNLGLD